MMIIRLNHNVKCFQKCKSYDGQTKWMYFLIESDNKVNSYIRKEFDSKPVYNKKFLKTKIKSYGDEVTDFHDKEISKVGYDHTCLTVINGDSALWKNKEYYPKVILKECKYIEKGVTRHITDDLESSFDDSDEG